jgi:GNAT superfamily N-acetyltransferase
MAKIEIAIGNSNESEIGSFLEERLYDFNVQATGITDGMMLNALVHDEMGNVIAGINGHTWGGCCEIKQLWVDEAYRRQGLGYQLMQAAEQEARHRHCHQILLATHSFQAPHFYEKLGFDRLASVPDYPQGHQQIFYIKRLLPK